MGLTINTNGILKEVCISRSQKEKIKIFKNSREVSQRYKNENYRLMENGNKTNEVIIYDKVNKKFILENPRTAGREKYIPINTQRIYQGIHFSIRKKVVDALHKWLKEQIINNTKHWSGFKHGEFPLELITIFYRYGKTKCADIDNMSYIYQKCFLDTLREMRYLPEDNPDYIIGILSYIRFIEPYENEKIIFSLNKCTFNDTIKSVKP